tara:strand:+ start:230 stop:433 length:204 start_codon:yes stop_codon:yes gene_type:complete
MTDFEEKLPNILENNWVKGLDGEWKETNERGGWVKTVDTEWEFIPGSGKWENENGKRMKWKWIPDKK